MAKLSLTYSMIEVVRESFLSKGGTTLRCRNTKRDWAIVSKQLGVLRAIVHEHNKLKGEANKKFLQSISNEL